MFSPRTAKYVAALIREGDNFDYDQWLKMIREEEAQAKQILTAITPRDVVAARADHPINTSDSRDARPSLSPVLIRSYLKIPDSDSLFDIRHTGSPKPKIGIPKRRSAGVDHGPRSTRVQEKISKTYQI